MRRPDPRAALQKWIPAFAGMTAGNLDPGLRRDDDTCTVAAAKAGAQFARVIPASDSGLRADGAPCTVAPAKAGAQFSCVVPAKAGTHFDFLAA